MSEDNINRWNATITPKDDSKPWTIKSGGSWDMLDVKPIPDAMMAELARMYHYSGAPWNCKSMPLSDRDREYMYLLYFSMQGFVARVRQADKHIAELTRFVSRLAYKVKREDTDNELVRSAMDYMARNGLLGSPLRTLSEDKKEGMDCLDRIPSNSPQKKPEFTVTEIAAAFNVPVETLEAMPPPEDTEHTSDTDQQ